MAWKPWYERMAEIDSAQEREEFLQGAFGLSTTSGSQKAAALLGGFVLGWGLGKAMRGRGRK